MLNLDNVGKRLEKLLNLIMNDPDLYSPIISQFFNNNRLLSLVNGVHKQLQKR
jgi:hypothetical protein